MEACLRKGRGQAGPSQEEELMGGYRYRYVGGGRDF